MGTKIILFGEMSSGVMKEKWDCLAIKTIVMFGGKGGGLPADEHHPNREAWGWQHHVVVVLCCRKDWCTSQNRWHHEGGKLLTRNVMKEIKAEINNSHYYYSDISHS